MRTSTEGARRGTPPAEFLSQRDKSAALLQLIVTWLDEAKAEAVVTIDIGAKSSIGDYMVVASGRSDRHVGAIAEQLREKLRESGRTHIRVEGLQSCDWVLIDTGDLIVHVFRPEVRDFYNLEKMWSGERPGEQPAAH